MMQSIRWLLDHRLALEFVLALSLMAVLQLGIQIVLKKSKEKAKKEKGNWQGDFDDSVATPIRILLWILMTSALLEMFVREYNWETASAYLSKIRDLSVVGCISWFLFRWKTKSYERLAVRFAQVNHKQKVDSLTLELGGKILTILILFVSLILFLQVLGVSVMPLLTFSGIGAAAIGFAGKDTISNLFGGMMIYITRSFKVQDFIELPQRNLQGSVEEIGWYVTCIRDPQKKPIYIPNSVFSTEPIINYYRMTHRRIEETLLIKYSSTDKIKAILEEIREIFNADLSVDRSESMYIYLDQWTESQVKIELKVYLLDTGYDEFMRSRQRLFFKVINLLEEKGMMTTIPSYEIILADERAKKPSDTIQ
jgi:MscS family membrane protein